MKQLERKDIPEVSGGSDTPDASYDLGYPIDPVLVDYPQNPIVPPTFDHQTS